MKIKFLKTYNALIAILLVVFGISCVASKEYGTPDAKFIVKGKVSSKETKEPIEDIRVTMNWHNDITNEKGDYRVENNDFPGDRAFLVKFHDTKGIYMDLDTLIEFKNPQFTGGDKNWYSGETSKTVDIQLTEKDNG